jgi:multiple sugar transport system permease protein
MNLRRVKTTAIVTIRWVLIAVAFAFFLFPIYWLFTTSIKTQVDVFATPPKLVLFWPTLENFLLVFTHTPYPLHALNSLIAASANTVLSLLLGTMAAYAMSRFKTGGNRLLFWFLSLRMVPPIVVAVPLYIVAAKLWLVDTRIILPVLYLLLNVPFAVWMMKSFIDEVPIELEESAFLDGGSYSQIIRRIILPIIGPGLVATGAFCFIFSWNELLLAMIFTRVTAVTLPVGVSGFITAEQTFWGQLTAYGSLAALPPLILALIFQRYMVRGLTLGALK